MPKKLRHLNKNGESIHQAQPTHAHFNWFSDVSCCHLANPKRRSFHNNVITRLRILKTKATYKISASSWIIVNACIYEIERGNRGRVGVMFKRKYKNIHSGSINLITS